MWFHGAQTSKHVGDMHHHSPVTCLHTHIDASHFLNPSDLDSTGSCVSVCFCEEVWARDHAEAYTQEEHKLINANISRCGIIIEDATWIFQDLLPYAFDLSASFTMSCTFACVCSPDGLEFL